MTLARLCAAGLIASAFAAATPCVAEDAVRIGLIVPMTGPFTATGRQLVAGAKLYMQGRGDIVAGRKIELVIRDDAGNAEITKRLAQELVVNDKVSFLAGFGLTPGALAAAPIATEAKIPEVVMMAATSVITERSPYIVRTSFSVPQTIVPLADWAAANGIRKVMTVVSDYAPGIDVETAFRQRFEAAGVGPIFVRQFVERGLDKSGIKFIAEGSLTEDDIVNQIGDPALGIITSQHYSAAHDSPENRSFVADFRKANGGLRPNMVAMQSHDGMHLIYEALKKTNGSTNGDAVVSAMKGLSWVSPRGPVTIDPETREMIQNIYIRRVERIGGELYNVEFATIPDFKDPSKLKR